LSGVSGCTYTADPYPIGATVQRPHAYTLTHPNRTRRAHIKVFINLLITVIITTVTELIHRLTGRLSSSGELTPVYINDHPCDGGLITRNLHPRGLLCA
jgi:hypothetical protein